MLMDHIQELKINGIGFVLTLLLKKGVDMCYTLVLRYEQFNKTPLGLYINLWA